MQITVHSASELTLDALTDLFNRSFEGYFFTFNMTPEVMAARLAREHADLALSRVATAFSEPVAVVLLAVRGSRCRVTGMGTIASARRQGIGRRLMEAVMPLLRERDFKRLSLEVIQQNEAALGLYRAIGLEVTRPLLGYELASAAGPTPVAGDLSVVDATEVARAVAAEGATDLPWQLDAAQVAGWGPPAIGYVLRGDDSKPKAWALVYDPTAPQIKILGFVVARCCRREGWGQKLLAALRHRHEGRFWEIPALVPEGLADDFLTRMGFVRSTLKQFEMASSLCPNRPATAPTC
jgi:ribosomal protein S18 acetylase RimI-like enzyme